MSLMTGRFSLPLVARCVKLSGPSTNQKLCLGLVTTPTTRTSFHSDSLPTMHSMLDLSRDLRDHKPPSPPCQLSTVGFQTLDSFQPIEGDVCVIRPEVFLPHADRRSLPVKIPGHRKARIWHVFHSVALQRPCVSHKEIASCE